MRRFANSFCPVCTHTLSFVLNDLRRSFAPNHLICRLKCTESAPKIGSDTPELVAMLRLRGLQETSNQDLRPFRRSRRVEQLLSAVPTKNSVQIEIVAFTEPQPVTFPGHADSTFLSTRLFPSSCLSASRDSCSPTGECRTSRLPVCYANLVFCGGTLAVGLFRNVTG